MGSLRDLQTEATQERVSVENRRLATEALLNVMKQTYNPQVGLSDFLKNIETAVSQGADLSVELVVSKFGRNIVSHLLDRSMAYGEDEERVAILKTLEFLLDVGATVNPDDLVPGMYDRLLPESVRRGFYGLTRKLIDAGWDVNSGGDCDNDTALVWAIVNENPEMVKFLVSRGADVNWDFSVHNSIRGLAEEWGNEDVLKLLTDAGMK